MACASLWARKTRSALSILGVVVGVLTVAGLLSIAIGVKEEVTRSIEGLGSNLVVVVPGKVDGGGSPNFFAQLGASTLTEDDVVAIRSQAPEAFNVAMAMLLAGTVKAGERSLDSSVIFASSPGFEAAFNLKRGDGRFLDAVDEAEKAHVVVLGAGVAQDLFGNESAIGKEIEIRGNRFAVVGVLAEIATGVNFGGPDMNAFVMMPLQTGWEISGTKQIFRIVMQAPDAESLAPLQEKVHGILLERHRGEEDFSVLTQEDLVGLVSSILDVVTAMLSAIAAISLVVGGIGIMNIMLVSVSERTREIGTRKAVGATRFAILVQFLVEAIMLTSLGGVIALGAFSIAVILIKERIPIPLQLDPFVLALALGFSVLVGLVFGILPAFRASRMHPIEALRHE